MSSLASDSLITSYNINMNYLGSSYIITAGRATKQIYGNNNFETNFISGKGIIFDDR